MLDGTNEAAMFAGTVVVDRSADGISSCCTDFTAVWACNTISATENERQAKHTIRCSHRFNTHFSVNLT